LFRRLTCAIGHSIRKATESHAEQKAFYRFINNKKVTEEALIAELTERTSHICAQRTVLAIQDTSEVNLSAHQHRIKADSGIGRLDSARPTIGFKLHPTLVVDAQSLYPLGFASLDLWHRPVDMPDRRARNYQSLKIEDKESYKWIRASNRTKEVLSQATQVIIIQDREGDIYDQLSTIPDEKHHLIIRSKANRNLTDGGLLWDTLSQTAPSGTYQIKVEGDNRRKVANRTATIEVRFLKTSIKRSTSAGTNTAKNTSLYAVEAREINSTDSNPILWRLVTSLPVLSYEDACMIVQWYSCRWLIEQLFRLLKHKGFNIEGSELEQGWAIRKLCILTLSSILKIIQMKLSYGEEEGQDINEVFSETEQLCLNDLNNKLAGTTAKQKNPFDKSKLNWATWIISRLGGWKGYASQRCAGLITMRNGLERFYLIYEGWMIARDVGTR
jgi:hypothetical protein